MSYNDAMADSYRQWTKNAHLNAGATPPRIAAVLAVYNKPRDFALCLEGYRRQSFFINHHQEFHLIAADDGSVPEIERIFSEFADQVSFPCTYLRKKHSGWGKLRMMNWATLECQAERIIFTDADCIPHREFLESHYEASQPDTVYCGRRVDLMDEISKKLSAEDVRSGKIESKVWLLKNMVQDKIDFGEQGFFLPKALAKTVPLFSKNSRPTLVGSNFSILKKHLVDLNGFDESFIYPGYGEDTDLERRLALAGLNLEWITYRAIQYHLWHPLTPVGEESKAIFESMKARGQKRASQGLEEFRPVFEAIPKSVSVSA